MLAELKQYSSAGDRKGLLYFCQLVLFGGESNIKNVEALCRINQNIRLNFNCMVLLCQDLSIIRIEEEQIVPCWNGGSPKVDSLNALVLSLCKRCFNHLLTDNLISIDRFVFDENIRRFYAPKKSFKLASSVYRNLLVELEAMEYQDDNIIISKDYEEIFAKEINTIKRNLTQKELIEKLKREEEQGEAGEQFALEYEKHRCDFSYAQQSQIMQISKIAVAAGYDIISFNSPDDLVYNRRIEVKTYQGNPHFYWSENEVEVARMVRDDYYIYLVDYNNINVPGYEPMIIQNPYQSVFENHLWNVSPNSFLVTKNAL